MASERSESNKVPPRKRHKVLHERLRIVTTQLDMEIPPDPDLLVYGPDWTYKLPPGELVKAFSSISNFNQSINSSLQTFLPASIKMNDAITQAIKNMEHSLSRMVQQTNLLKELSKTDPKNNKSE